MSRGKSPKYADEIRQYPVFAQKCNLFNGDISLEKARFLDPNTLSKWGDEYKLRDGDVLVNSTGTGTVGRTRLFHSDVLGDYPFVVPDSHVSVIRTFDEIESKYVYAYLSSVIIQKHLEDNLAGSTNQRELYIDVLGDLAFPLPPKVEQVRIITEIEKWFGLISAIEDDKQDLEEFVKQAKSKTLSLAISGKLVAQDPSDEPAIELLKRINPRFILCDISHYVNIPLNWCVCTLKDIFEITMGSSPSGNTLNREQIGVEFHQGKIYFTEKYIAHSDIYTTLPTKTSKANSILLCVRAPVGVVNITEREICIGRGLCALFPKQHIDLMYAFYAIQTYQRMFDEKATGTTFKAIGSDAVRNELFLLPPYREQVRIRESLDKIFASLDTIVTEL